jgi:hypothetical protein
MARRPNRIACRLTYGIPSMQYNEFLAHTHQIIPQVLQRYDLAIESVVVQPLSFVNNATFKVDVAASTRHSQSLFCVSIVLAACRRDIETLVLPIVLGPKSTIFVHFSPKISVF